MDARQAPGWPGSPARWTSEATRPGPDRSAAPEPFPLVIVVRPGARTRSILGWLRQLVPAALLVVAAGDMPPPAPPDAIVLDDQEVASGPLSLADALTRHRAGAMRPTTATNTPDG